VGRFLNRHSNDTRHFDRFDRYRLQCKRIIENRFTAEEPVAEESIPGLRVARVVSGVTVNVIRSLVIAGIEMVLAVAADQVIRTLESENDVISGILGRETLDLPIIDADGVSVERVVPATCTDQVISASAEDVVIAAAAQNYIITGPAEE
jgi:hypothetical protein